MMNAKRITDKDAELRELAVNYPKMYKSRDYQNLTKERMSINIGYIKQSGSVVKQPINAY